MKKSRKRRLVVAASVVVVLLGGWWMLQRSLHVLVKSRIESVGTQAAGTPVTLERVDLSLWSGRGEITGFAIANPDGFDTEHAFRLGRVDARRTAPACACFLGQEPLHLAASEGLARRAGRRPAQAPAPVPSQHVRMRRHAAAAFPCAGRPWRDRREPPAARLRAYADMLKRKTRRARR